QQRSFPSESPVEPAKHACECSSHQVVRNRPAVAVHPNLVECLSFCQRDNGSDRARVGQEVCRSREAQQYRMTSDPSFASCEVVNVISHCCCERTCAEVNRDL